MKIRVAKKASYKYSKEQKRIYVAERESHEVEHCD